MEDQTGSKGTGRRGRQPRAGQWKQLNVSVPLAVSDLIDRFAAARGIDRSAAANFALAEAAPTIRRLLDGQDAEAADRRGTLGN